ncbi:MAG: DUF1549 and DUF1553 domain-containing protein [Acidobacteriota bacterium]|nr:DUF1549 and DUF1553 domain-containing protein [Acidobacteriota bacterium]
MTRVRNVLALSVAAALIAGNVGAGWLDTEPLELKVEPETLRFGSIYETRRVIVTAIGANNRSTDLTGEAKFESELLEGSEQGFVTPTRTGQGRLRISVEGQSIEVPVTVADDSVATVSFVRDVVPVMNKVGCGNGTCHGAQKGKNGFRLSLRGYDPQFDYQALLYDMSGRRFNRAAPAQSLMLTKPTMQTPHVGGLTIERDTRYYNTILDWISQGVPFGNLDADRVQSLEVYPKEIFMAAPHKAQHLAVVAHYRDGRTRDVTREAHFESSNTESFLVEDPAIAHSIRRGEGAVLVRYEGQYATVPVTVLSGSGGFRWSRVAQHSYIDELIDEKLQRVEVQPSEIASDSEFLRRVTLDLTGRIPDAETVLAFLDDPARPRQKRAQAINKLIGNDAFVDHWTLKWGDLLRSNRKYMSYKGMWTFREWLHDSVAANMPFDDFARKLLTSRGSTFESPATGYYRAARGAKEAMETTTQLFMGVRMVCAQCHDHPFEKWTQEQYYQMTAFFSTIGIRPGFETGEEIVYDKRVDRDVLHPKYDHVVDPEFLVPIEGAAAPSDTARSEALTDWLVSPENPFFARAITNRVWSYFMGRGIIEPVDDVRDSNPAVNEPLLAALTADLVANDFDLRHLMRRIVSSRAYQSSFRPTESNADDDLNFSHHHPRRLTAEQLADAVAKATGSRFEIPSLPEDFQAAQLPDPHVDLDGFLDLFGRPDRESACECERKSEMSLPQAMNLLNGPIVAEAIADPDGRVAQLILSGASQDEIVDELYLATFSRLPTAEERSASGRHFESHDSRATAAQDLLWALMNSNAFLFNV